MSVTSKRIAQWGCTGCGTILDREDGKCLRCGTQNPSPALVADVVACMAELMKPVEGVELRWIPTEDGTCGRCHGTIDAHGVCQDCEAPHAIEHGDLSGPLLLAMMMGGGR